MLETKKLVKTFDGFRALDELDLSVPKGAVYGLVGPNGAGKTTLIRHLAGILRPDSGEVLLDGSPVYENTEAKRRMAVIPDDVFYYTQASTADMMKFYKGVWSNFDVDRYEKLREAFTLDDKKPVRTLSKGMQKQAAFWLALSLRPEVLILDEPVDGLDPVMRRQVWSLVLADVAENGTTVLVSSHNLRELEDVCDHVGIMNRGKNLLERSLSELQDNVAKILIALPEGTELPKDLEMLHESATGRLRTLILRGRPEQLTDRLQILEPLFMDAVPLSLEEIFIYELGGADYAVKNILL
ncbi:MAG: ABC transporter ATP-binding protein [Oscillospiraceae bacterium]|nr:ABC transporter ATP-binding protein [Oscillospiraceae bacterium]